MENEIEYERRLTAVEARAQSNTHRLGEVEKRQSDLEELTSTVKVLAVREEAVETDVKEIKKDVKGMAERPAKRWEMIVAAVIGAIGGALGSALIGLILK